MNPNANPVKGTKGGSQAKFQAPSPPSRPTPLPSLPTDPRTSDYGWMRDTSRSQASVMTHLAAENAYSRLLLLGSKEQKLQVVSMRKEIEAHVWAEAMNHALDDDSHEPSPSPQLLIASSEQMKYTAKLTSSSMPTDARWLRGREEASLLLPSRKVNLIFGSSEEAGKLGEADGDASALIRHGPFTLSITSLDGHEWLVPRVSGPFLWSPDGSELFFLASGKSQLWAIHPSSSSPTRPRLILTDPDWLEMEFVTLTSGLRSLQAKNNDGTTADAYLLIQSAIRKDGDGQLWKWERLALDDSYVLKSRGGRRMHLESLDDSRLIVTHWSVGDPYGSLSCVHVDQGGFISYGWLMEASLGCRILTANIADAESLLVVEEEIDSIEREAIEMASRSLMAETITPTSHSHTFDPNSFDIIEVPSQCSFRIRLFKIEGTALIEHASSTFSLPIPFVLIHEVRLLESGLRVEVKLSSWCHLPHTLLIQLTKGGASCQSDMHMKPQYDLKYIMRRIWFRSHDGCLIPISIISLSPRPLSAQSPPPVLIRAYGAYGLSDDLAFSPSRLPLVDRGWILATVHVRGGGQLGPIWHEAGKGKRRVNGARDLQAAIQHLSFLFGGTESIFLEAESAGAWSCLPSIASSISPSDGLVKGALLTVPSLDPVSDALGQGYAWHELIPEVNELSSLDDIHTAPSYKYLRTEIDPLASSLTRTPLSWPKSLLIRCGLQDARAGYWEGAGLIALARAAAPGGQGICCLRVKEGGHDAFISPQDDAEACSFFIHAFELER